MPELYYFHDPMCSWCWGFRPTAERLFAGLPSNVVRINKLGGLAADSDVSMPAAQQRMIKSHWQRIEATLGTEFNYEFWSKCTPRRSTYPACRGVIAAANQGHEEAMIKAIQTAYYLQARNPSDTSTQVELAAEQGLNVDVFAADLQSAATEIELRSQIDFTRQCGVSSFPSLVLDRGGDLYRLNIDYASHESTLAQITQLASASADDCVSSR